MQVVEVRIARAGFGDILGEMREWIDRHGGDPVKFDTSTDSNGDIVIRLEFARAELGFAFRRDWALAVIGTASAAA